MKVIIVDDEPAARRALRECCAAEADLEITGEYGNPREALVAIRANPPDLLFLDIQMDVMTGIELARALFIAALLCIAAALLPAAVAAGWTGPKSVFSDPRLPAFISARVRMATRLLVASSL